MAHLGNTIVNGALRVIGGENVDTINGVTVGTSPKFTDASVTQTATTTDANYEVLFSATADNTTRTEGARKTATLRFNPSKGALMEGDSTAASGSQSHAEGYYTAASGNQSHAEGNYTTASGVASHAEGYNTKASGAEAHAEGGATNATNSYTHAEGYGSTASGQYSHASGQYTCAAGTAQTVVGKYNAADTTSLFIVGNGTSSARSNALCVNSDNTTTLGASGSIASDNTKAVNGGTVYSFVTGGSARDNTKLALSGGTVTGNVNLKRSTINAQASNNGLSSGIEYPTTFNILDKNDLIMVRNEGVISSDGSIAGYWYVRNYNGSTTQVAQKGIKMTMNKSGTLTYTVDDAANFRSAISAAASSHTHPINQVTWAGGLNLAPTATANSQEWSIDLTPGSYTGTYFHIYSAKNSKSILQCFTDSNEVVVPSGNLKVTGGKIFASKTINQIIAGTGTAAQDKGSGVSPRYFPARWAFNMGIATPAHGDIITIKIPVAGHDYGVFISTDNGTTYRPVTVTPSGTSRLTTHYASGALITLIYDSAGTTNSVYAAAGADARSNVSGGCWRVVNFYDTGNTYDRNRFNASIKAWGTKIIAGNIIVGTGGLYHHLKEGTAFDITYPILYLNGDCNASSTTTNTYDILNFTVTTTQSITLTAYKPVYIKGTLSGTTFTPISTTPLTQTVPSSADNYYYMFLGNATSTTAVYLTERHEIYAYKNGAFREISSNIDFLPLSGGTMTGQLRTSFNSAVATGSYAPTANTIPNLCTELRYSSGVMGSVSINTEYTKDGVAIPTGWYNFMWIPHRSGGNNGAASGDNCDYGVLYLTAMTMESSFYLIRFSSGSITEVKNVLANNEYVINGGIFYDPQLSKFAKTSADGWDKQVYSRKGYKNNVYVRFKAGQTNKAIMVGLNSDPTTDANYTSIDFCWYLQNNGTLAIYESGTAVNTIASGTNPTYVSGEEFYIEVHNNYIYYYRNNDALSEPKLERVSKNKFTSSSSNFNKLYFDSSFHGQSGFIYDVEFGVNSQSTARLIVENNKDGALTQYPLTFTTATKSAVNEKRDTSLETNTNLTYIPAYNALICGSGSKASGYEAFALGYEVQANANSSMAMGEGTRASGEGQLVIGKYNGVQGNGALFVIGNGSSDSARSNALVIGVDGRFYPTNTFPESYLGWNEVSAGDGRDLTADVSPIDACLNDVLKGNRFFGIPDSNISITYSRNAGSTWTDYGGEAYQKTALFAEGSNFTIGKADGTNKATANGNKYQLRVWVDTLNVCYTVLRKIMVNISTQGSNECTMDFEVSTDNSSWTKIRTMAIAGWSGWNVMNVGWIQTHNAYRYLRFTFKANGGDTNYNGLSIFQIYGYGGFGWIASSQMAASATPYIAYGSKAAQFLGTLAVSSNNYNNYNEGIRINVAPNGAAVLTMGGTWGSLSGMSDYAWCFVTWSTTRRLIIGHGTSGSGSSTYFYKNDAGATPSLHIGENLQVDGTITGRMADYAEYFEWADGNPRSEERIAKFVTFDDGNKIRFATSNDDYILGVVSAHPFIIGNADGDDRDNEYLKDEYGRVIIEPTPKMKSSTDGKYIPVYDEHGKPVYEGTRPKPNPDYDPSKNVPRDKKPEWAPIGMLGILTVIDDGTCTVNSYATVGVGGIATRAESNSLFKYRVIKRRTNNIIDIIFR